MCLEQGEQKENSPRFLTAQKDGNEIYSVLVSLPRDTRPA